MLTSAGPPPHSVPAPPVLDLPAPRLPLVRPWSRPAELFSRLAAAHPPDTALALRAATEWELDLEKHMDTLTSGAWRTSLQRLNALQSELSALRGHEVGTRTGPLTAAHESVRALLDRCCERVARRFQLVLKTALESDSSDSF